jgi:3-hydroxyacyl-[acyl-carrier-protein] dehydratase
MPGGGELERLLASDAGSVLDSVAVQALLAHRHPFLLVDRIHVVEPARRVIGVKQITYGEWWSEGQGIEELHFPFPLVIEALAQTSGALVRDLSEEVEGAVAYFMGVDHVRLRRKARPGDELLMELTLRQWRRGICRTRGVATVNGEVVVTGNLTTVVRRAT